MSFKNNQLLEWNKVKLIDIADFLNGYAFKSEKYINKGIRVIRIANVQDGFISDEKPCFYPIETKEDIKNYLLFENDLLISLTATRPTFP
ncbi:MAG: restriction endonuclease subunit S, partial [Treponema sp.]|nr:restriction endonuclease subunit S [Treponema sp.]